MAGKYNFLCEQGATLAKTLTVRDENTGLPVNYVNYTAQMMVRRTHDATTALLDLTTTNDMLVISGNYGQIIVLVAKEDTVDLPVGKWVYDLYLTSPTGVRSRLLEGTFVVTPTVTREP